MSNFSYMTPHPKTNQWEMAVWSDDYFGIDGYVIKFADGYIATEEEIPSTLYKAISEFNKSITNPKQHEKDSSIYNSKRI